MPRDERRTVYSTEDGDLRKQPEDSIQIAQSLSPSQQTIYLHRESKGRGGKTVSIVKNLQLTSDDMKELAKHLKKVCGTGGTIKDQIIEIQGEHREKIAAALEKLGYKVRIAGG